MITLDMPIEHPDVLGEKLARTDGAILVGPWLSELGFEIAYWIPFLRWLTQTYHLDRNRLWVISRGGCASWYTDFAAHYLDIFDWYSPRAFRKHNVRRVKDRQPGFPKTATKQYHITQFDLNILSKVAWYVNITSADIIHPAVLYRWFRSHWRPNRSDRVGAYTRLHPWRRPRADPSWPVSYVAMKFYHSPSSPDTSQIRRSLRAILDAVSATSHVLLLHDETRYDDHSPVDLATHPRVQLVPLVPRTNLETQTAVIGNAARFIGTYGGFSYMAPMLGVPTLCVYGKDNFHHGHLDRMIRICTDTLRVPFDVVPVDDAVPVAQNGYVRVA